MNIKQESKASSILLPAILLTTLCLTSFNVTSAPDSQNMLVAAADTEGRECRSEEATGSRMRKKQTCLTPEEWAAIDKAREQKAEEGHRRASGSGAVTDQADPIIPSAQ